MDINICFYSKAKKKACVRYFDSKYLGHAIASYHPSTPALSKSLISRLVYLKILRPKLGDKDLSQFTFFIENCVKKILKMYHHLIGMNKG